jgi:hypothetical protein
MRAHRAQLICFIFHSIIANSFLASSSYSWEQLILAAEACLSFAPQIESERAAEAGEKKMSEWADEVDDPAPALAGADGAKGQRQAAQAKPQGGAEQQAEPKLKAKPKVSPFGNAKPREEVLAQREGKREQDVIKQEAQTFQPKLSLSRQQREQKESLESEISSLQQQRDEGSSAKQVQLIF